MYGSDVRAPLLVVNSTSLALPDLTNESDTIIGVHATSQPYLERERDRVCVCVREREREKGLASAHFRTSDLKGSLNERETERESDSRENNFLTWSSGPLARKF